MVALAAHFGLDSGQTGLLTTVPLVAWAVGGALAGVLADRIGRVGALMITVVTYAVLTVACGFAPTYETLLLFRSLQGLGFGGEWEVGAILVAEYTSARHRGRTLGAVQSSWAVGRGLAAIGESSLLPAVHGSPVHCGDPSGLGIDDLGRPDFGEPVDAGPDDIPVFWACGVIPQTAVTASRPPFALTHAPGQMFLTDARDEQYRVA
ncbi:MFS transporter [Streptomyces sp. NPDC088766]|uniref:MFS transporter n=1 Tax=Streptomyces sp. NPDC088766 TaxID=3365893 RepID=UPI0037F7EA6F